LFNKEISSSINNTSNSITQVFSFLKTGVQLFIFQKYKKLIISNNLFTPPKRPNLTKHNYLIINAVDF